VANLAQRLLLLSHYLATVQALQQDLIYQRQQHQRQQKGTQNPTTKAVQFCLTTPVPRAVPDYLPDGTRTSLSVRLVFQSPIQYRCRQ
jgi:hypothetical protein